MLLKEVLLAEVGDAGDPGPRSTRPTWVSVVAYLRAESAGRTYVGGGATTLPPRLQSPWNAPAVAEGLSRAAHDLPGALLAMDGAQPLAVANQVTAQFDEAVGARTDSRWQRTALACVRGAVEIGVLDLLARVRGADLAELLGTRRPAPARSAGGLPVRPTADEIPAAVTAQHGRYPVTRLVTSGNVEQDLAALVTAENANVAAGGSRPVWLECAGRYSVPGAERLVAGAGQLFADGRLTARVYLGQPLPRARRRALAALTRQVRDLTAGSAQPDVRIVLDESVETTNDLAFFLRNGEVTAVSVGARRGIATALRVVERAVAANPDVTVVVSGTGQVTDLEAAAIEVTARVVPKLDLYLPGRGGVELMRNGEHKIDRGWRMASSPAGLGSPPSLPRLIGSMGRAERGRLHSAGPPAGTAVEHPEYDAFGLETLGKNSLDSYLLEREARRLGLTTVRFHGVGFHVVDRAGRSIGFHCTTGPTTSRYASKVCGQKQATRALLARAGVAVPAGRQFATAEQSAVVAYARSLGWPVVVKPPAGKGGRGVSANLSSVDALKGAVTQLGRDGHREVIVEKHVSGADYRFFVVGGAVVSVLRRQPGSVVGDGASSVAELVLAKNLIRQRNPHQRSRLLRLDDEAIALLESRGMTPDSVPEVGRHVRLTTAGNISRGGDGIEVLDESHPSLLDLAVRAVAAIPGLDHAGVDLLAEDHRRPLAEQDAAVCELNSLPATSSHHYPTAGPPRNVSRALMEHYISVYGLAADPRPDPQSVCLRITGQVQAVGYRQWLTGIAHQLGLSGWVRNSEQQDLVEAEVTGPLDRVTALCLRAIFGPVNARPELVETRPLSIQHTGEFILHP